jgi:hypothetical protein
MGEWDSRGGRRLHARGDASNVGVDQLEVFERSGSERYIRRRRADSSLASYGFSVPMNPFTVSSRNPRRLCFTFGSNMDPEQFRQRCPKSEVVGIAVLHDYQWYITRRGVASVRRDRGNCVFGLLLRLTAVDETRLDVCEGVHAGLYERRILAVDVVAGGFEKALVYIAEDGGVGKPRTGYLERVLAGARHHGLPAGAIVEMESWSQFKPDPSP